MTGYQAPEKCPFPLRRIELYDAEKNEILVYLTNHQGLGARTVAAIYKDRWQIEIFFKALKQYLKIKTFVGASANAVKIQIWTALIAILGLKYLQLLSKLKWSLSNLVALLRMNLFTHRDLMAWLNQPFATPPVPYEQEQLAERVGEMREERKRAGRGRESGRRNLNPRFSWLPFATSDT